MPPIFQPNDRARCVIPRIGLRKGSLYCVHAATAPTGTGEQFLFFSAHAWNCGDGHSSTRFELVRPSLKHHGC